MNPYRACADFHRTASLAESAVTRRQVILGGISAGLALYSARALPLERALDAAGEAHAQAPDAPILVVVFLPGGVDLLDTLVPLNQYGAYRDARGVLAQSDLTTPRLGNTGLGIHASLAQGDGEGIKGLFDRGQIGFLPGIDYANPDLSHFHSRHFWETGLITAKSTTGWLGRWLDTFGSAENPFQGLTSGHHLSPVLRTAAAPAAAIQSARGAALSMQGLRGAAYERAIGAFSEMAAPVPGEAARPEAVRRAARLARDVAVRLEPYKDTAPAPQSQPGTLPVIGQPPASGYPAGGFADRLRQLAFLLAQPLGVRIATVDADGDFDTHANQGVTLPRDLEEISRALAAFQADLAARGLANRVLTFVWSEFGRRVKANNSGGTDHGAGGNGWVMGPRAASGILTEYPSLGDLDRYANLKVTVDFRQVYASLVEQWLATDAAAVVPDAAAFARVQVVD